MPCLGKDDDGHDPEGEGSGISSCSDSEPDPDADREFDAAHGEHGDPEPRPLAFGKKTTKTLQAFQDEQCPHEWGILDAVKDLTVDANNVRMLPHASFDMSWAKSFSGWGKKEPKNGQPSTRVLIRGW